MRRLLYFHDPMCSWCWAFRPVWLAIRADLPPDLGLRQVLGGLAPDTLVPMPPDLRRKIQEVWKTIQGAVPGTEFNFDFWERCIPRRSTYPACRAVIAARRQGMACEDAMIAAIQRAYYLEARNPSDDATLIALARDIGLDPERFARTLKDPRTQQELQAEIAFGRSSAVDGFPSLILEENGQIRRIRIDYRDSRAVLRQI